MSISMNSLYCGSVTFKSMAETCRTARSPVLLAFSHKEHLEVLVLDRHAADAKSVQPEISNGPYFALEI